MYKNIYKPTASMKLGAELLELNCKVETQELLIEELIMKAAKYKAFFFGKHKLGEKLQKQIEENYNHSVGEFDGFSYASWRAKAIYRTLEDMVTLGLITESEYIFCQTL